MAKKAPSLPLLEVMYDSSGHIYYYLSGEDHHRYEPDDVDKAEWRRGRVGF